MNDYNILVTDDADEVREVLYNTISNMGYNVDTAANGKEALDKFRKNNYDLVLADIQMPKLDGIELLKNIREINNTVPVIMVTAYPSIGNAIEAMKLGATDFVTKPFQLDYLEVVVKRALDERKLILENRQLLTEVNKKAVIEKLNKQLHQKLKEISELYKISEEFNTVEDNENLFKKVVHLASKFTSAQKVSIMLLDREFNKLVLREAIGLDKKIIDKIVIPVGEGIAGKVVLEKKPVCYNVLNDEKIEIKERITRYQSKSYLCVPLIIGDEVFGVLNLTDKIDGGQFKEEDVLLITSLAQKAAIKIENNALYEGIYSNLVDTLKVLVSSIEAKDHYTKEHSQRVTRYALAIAEELGCSDEDLEKLQFSGIIHDIGKIGIRDYILLKEGKLTPEEYEAIKQHPVIADNIVKPLGLIQSERGIIRHHHERIDGAGYPDKLSGEEIPFLARILAVADAFDAMTSTRPYRDSLSVSVAIDELRRCSGTQFEPKAVKAMLRCIEQGLLHGKLESRLKKKLTIS